MVGPGPTAVLDAAEGAALLVIGLSDRWRQEGLGEARGALARSAPVPVLFVRRGHRPGALAPPEDVTRFTWSASTSAAGAERPAAHAQRSVRSLDAPGRQPHGEEQEPGHEPAEDEQ